jgi:hypothetical protein
MRFSFFLNDGGHFLWRLLLTVNEEKQLLPFILLLPGASSEMAASEREGIKEDCESSGPIRYFSSQLIADYTLGRSIFTLPPLSL